MIQKSLAGTAVPVAGSSRQPSQALESRTRVQLLPGRKALRSTSRKEIVAPVYSIASALDAGDSTALVFQIATAAAWSAVAFFAAGLLNQASSNSSKREGQVECEVCHGTGVVDCIVCTRWSDATSDTTGCSCCNGTRRMACHACGGGGTAVPIEAKVYIRPPSEY